MESEKKPKILKIFPDNNVGPLKETYEIVYGLSKPYNF
jgi:hypothetical protein